MVTRPATLLRVLLDGVGSEQIAADLVPGLAAAGRTAVRVRAADFQRPAGERFTWGREDELAFRTSWLDYAALEREVLSRTVDYLPALWDAERDRSARQERRPFPPQAVLLVDGIMLLGHPLSSDLIVHVALSAAALARAGVPDWQQPAFAAYDREVRPGEICDVLVRAERPQRPAVLHRWKKLSP